MKSRSQLRATLRATTKTCVASWRGTLLHRAILLQLATKSVELQAAGNIAQCNKSLTVCCCLYSSAIGNGVIVLLYSFFTFYDVISFVHTCICIHMDTGCGLIVLVVYDVDDSALSLVCRSITTGKDVIDKWCHYCVAIDVVRNRYVLYKNGAVWPQQAYVPVKGNGEGKLALAAWQKILFPSTLPPPPPPSLRGNDSRGETLTPSPFDWS